MKNPFCITILTLVLILMGNVISVRAQELHPAEEYKDAKTIGIDFPTVIEFENDLDYPVKIFRLDERGRRVFHIELPTKKSRAIETPMGVPFLVTDPKENALAIYYPDAQPRHITLTEEAIAGARVERGFSEGDGQPVVVCADQPIPRGFLIVKAGSDQKCPNWSAFKKNTYAIRRPDPQKPTVICGGQKIPRGFVIVSTGEDMGCPNWEAFEKNTFTIRRPRETEIVCSNSPIPQGYVVTGTGSDMKCPNWEPFEANTKKIKRL
ncbi:MAG: hypothetical protein R2747_22805 [Pyrinomonadaceae bacterium]